MKPRAPKRITAILDQAEFVGGAEYFVLDFLAGLTPTDLRRVSPIIVGGASDEYKAKCPEAVPIVDFVYPGVSGSKWNQFLALFRLLFAAVRLKKVFKQNHVTQVFSNTPRTHFIMWFARKIGYRGHWTAMFHDFTTRPNWLIASIGAQADTVVANSLPTRSWLKSTLKPKDHSKIRIVENGVNFAACRSPQFPQQITKVLNLGRIDPLKGQMSFVEAADLLLERNPDVEFTIVGDPVASNQATLDYAAEIKQFIKDRSLKNCQFLPGVADPLATINEYDALVFTPTAPETFGRVVIEALALGKLVIAFDQTGPREILQAYQKTIPAADKYDFSLLTESGNAMSLAETIGYFADNPKALKIFTEEGPAFVKKHFNLEETKKRLLDVLLV